MTTNFKVFEGPNVDSGPIGQFLSACVEPYVTQAALMPDAHLGYSLPIGAVVATEGVVVPSWVGYDIGCGVCAIPTTFDIEAVKAHKGDIFKELHKRIPTGFHHNEEGVDWQYEHLDGSNALWKFFWDEKRPALKQLGTLGGGNHFIEVAYSPLSNRVWIVIHSGSRGLGHTVATHYMKLASPDGKAREGHYGVSYPGPVGSAYYVDQKFCVEFALANRLEMLNRCEEAVQKFVGGAVVGEDLINRSHNHVEKTDQGELIHRKGATHAEKGMMGVIPGNMRDGSFIVKGLGNQESLCSSSHGAGRLFSRKEAKQRFNRDEFDKGMYDVAHAVVPDEGPHAYKNIFDVMGSQKDLVTVVDRVKPIVNVKG